MEDGEGGMIGNVSETVVDNTKNIQYQVLQVSYRLGGGEALGPKMPLGVCDFCESF